MPKDKMDFDTVRKIARALAGVEESTMHGSPALKVHGKLLACIPVHKSAEPGSLGVRIDFDQRAELVENAPDTYYLTDHYLDYPMVLVRLSSIRIDALKDLLSLSWRFVTAKQPRGGQTARKQSRTPVR